MKGLITKDFCLMLQRKRSFIVILMCGLVMSFSSDATFFVGWMIMIGSLFALSTIAYDEHDNSYPFLMTLPISRKGYACEKYVFGAICGLAFWLCALVFYIAAAAIRGISIDFANEIAPLIIMLFVPMLILDFCIPFNLKYGSEKGRIYMIIFWGVIFTAVFVLYKLLAADKGIPASGFPLALPALLILLAVFTIVLTAASVIWSIRIMEKKEF